MAINTKSHRRFNILTGEWILVSPHRTKRPWQGKRDDIVPLPNITYDKNCYLCPGNERMGGAVNPNYTNTFSFQNDFAALIEDQKHETFTNGFLKAETEEGICKVVCFSPDHSLTIPLMTIDAIAEVINLWQKEYKELGNKAAVNHVQIFENKGSIMGCSNPHPHGQIWAQSSIPEIVLQKQKQQKLYWDTNKKSLLANYIQQEIKLDERIILKNNHL